MKKQSLLLYLILTSCLFSCNINKKEPSKKNQNLKKNKFIEILSDKSKIDTTKDYQKQSLIFKYPNQIKEDIEIYTNKNKDTFYNQFKFYKKDKIDSLKSKFYVLEIEGLKKDSLFNGKISFFSPADSIPKRKMESRHVSFIYLQRENDSLIFKEIKTNKNIINFKYKNFDNNSFVGYISDLRFFNVDSLSDKLLLNRNFFAIDSEVSTNNPYVSLLK